MKRKIAACLSAIMLCMGAMVFAPSQAGAANLVRSGRYQFVGPNNEFWDVPFAQYDDGIYDFSINLWSNSPRVFQGTVFKAHTRDYTVLPAARVTYNGSHVNYFDMCSNVPWDEYAFYSWAKVYPDHGGTYTLDMVQYLGVDSGFWVLRSMRDGHSYPVDGWFTYNGDDRVGFLSVADGTCIQVALY